MGIQGLLPFVKKACREVHIKEFSGGTAAVDTYCWLHKGAFSCAERLAKGEKTDGQRETNRQKAKQFLIEGRIKEARECYQRAVDITPEMALDLIKECRRRGIDYIVAPYEADAQLAYLTQRGLADVVITEDSDLILFGCEKVVFKMDQGGFGTLYERSAIGKCLGNC
ncbi:exonuclease, putative, partial [Ixodes scapularis]